MEKKNAWEKYPEGTKRQVVIHFFRIDACVECCGIEWSDAVGKTFLNEVVA